MLIRCVGAFLASAAETGIEFAVLDKRRFSVRPADGLGAPVVHENRSLAVALARIIGAGDNPPRGRDRLVERG